jgi:hypothetical protein
MGAKKRNKTILEMIRGTRADAGYGEYIEGIGPRTVDFMWSTQVYLYMGDGRIVRGWLTIDAYFNFGDLLHIGFTIRHGWRLVKRLVIYYIYVNRNDTIKIRVYSEGLDTHITTRNPTKLIELAKTVLSMVEQRLRRIYCRCNCDHPSRSEE